MTWIRQSLNQLVSLLSGNGLQREGRPPAKSYRTRPSELGLRQGFDATRLNQLIDELEVDGRLEGEKRLRRGGVTAPARRP
ncbi:MAG: hypothetical protein OXG74_01010 [Acidobacteria bacterium]|nr:hypothetical protein [Acidobacteriota bacterium]